MKTPGDGFLVPKPKQKQAVLLPKGSHIKLVTPKSTNSPTIKSQPLKQSNLNSMFIKSTQPTKKRRFSQVFNHKQGGGEKIGFEHGQDDSQFERKIKGRNRRIDGSIDQLGFVEVGDYEGFGGESKRRKLEKGRASQLEFESSEQEVEEAEAVDIAIPAEILEPDTDDEEVIPTEDVAFNEQFITTTTHRSGSESSEPDQDSDEDSNEEVQALLVGDDSGYLEFKSFKRDFTPVPDTQELYGPERKPPSPQTIEESLYNGATTYFEESGSPVPSTSSFQSPAKNVSTSTPNGTGPVIGFSSPLTPLRSTLKLSPLKHASIAYAFPAIEAAWSGQLPPSPLPPTQPKQTKITDFIIRPVPEVAEEEEWIMDSQAVCGYTPAEEIIFEEARRRSIKRRLEKVVEATEEEEEDQIEEVGDAEVERGMVVPSSDAEDEQIPINQDLEYLERFELKRLELAGVGEAADVEAEHPSSVESQALPESMLLYLDAAENGFDESCVEPWKYTIIEEEGEEGEE